jgi:DNA-binding MarR family transcriptional regulator
MRRLNRVISGIYDRAFRPIGATASQMGVLVVLARSGGSKPGEVCRALQMDKSTLCRNVQRMQRQGWVRTAATDDARSHRLEVTETGRGLIERALPLWRGAQAKARDVLGGAAVDQLFRAVDAPFPGDRTEDQAGTGGEAGASMVRDSKKGSLSASGGGKDGVRDFKGNARGNAGGGVGGDTGGGDGRGEEKSIFFWE